MWVEDVILNTVEALVDKDRNTLTDGILLLFQELPECTADTEEEWQLPFHQLLGYMDRKEPVWL